MKSYPARGLAALLAAGLALAATSPVAAVDRVNLELPYHVGRVLDYLKEHQLRNVGVLKFVVQKGKQETTFQAGRLNSIMANRLENFLAQMNTGKPPLSLILDAGKVAAARKEHLTQLTEEGRRRLFELTYPLPVGNARVRPDAFVTGRVEFSADRRKTTVVLQVVDRQGVHNVSSFEVATDRMILTDAGANYRVSHLRAAGPRKDDEATEDVRKQEQGGPAGENLVDLKTFYNGVEQKIQRASEGSPLYQVPEPGEGDKVMFTITNRTKETLAVVLAVNGVNTLHEEEVTNPSECTMWVLKPFKTYEIHGYYPEAGGRKPFRVLADDESEKEELNPNPKLGAIELFVFTAGQGGGKEKEPARSGSGSRKKLNAQGPKPRSYDELAQRARKQAGTTLKAQGVIKPDGQTEDVDIRMEEFKDPELAQGWTIWYYARKKQPSTGSTGGGTGPDKP